MAKPQHSTDGSGILFCDCDGVTKCYGRPNVIRNHIKDIADSGHECWNGYTNVLLQKRAHQKIINHCHRF